MNQHSNTHYLKLALLLSSLILPASVQAIQTDTSTTTVAQVIVKTAKSTEKTLTPLITSATKTDGVEHGAKSARSTALTKPGKKPANVIRTTVATNLAKTSTNGAATTLLDHDTWFNSIDVSLEHDHNNNGYYSLITVDFDADTHYEHAVVYATLSLTDPNGITIDYYTTDDFDLYGDSGDDTHQVETLLSSNWITDYYHLSIELFDAFSEEPLAFVDFHNAEHLDFLALESQDYDNFNQYLNTFSSRLWLQHDDDGDGYYHTFDIELDIDASFGSADVYAELYVSTDQFSWLPMYTSNHFTINQDSTSDMQHWEFNWIAGYPTSHYYIKAVIVDSDTNQTLLEVTPADNPAFAAIPLEDSSFEDSVVVVATDTSSNSTKTTVSSEHSGGSFGTPVMIVLMLCLAWMRVLKAS
jgi:hypothetical protein